MVKKIWWIVFGVLLLMNGILAESLTVTAQVDREKVALGDTVTYEITVSGKDLKNVPAPVLPNLNERFSTISTFT
ncbi:hypothetical protein HN928_01805, partial [bacterium]|nr:hypothetical protein [bacterium]